MADAFRRFLGVDEAAGPHVWLGLGADATRVQVERALQARLEQVFRHPDGSSDEAEQVRTTLRAAAGALIRANVAANVRTAEPSPLSELSVGAPVAPPPRRRPIQPHALTDFDRLVMATLVAGGGWNARSRARLVGLAAAHGVSPAGLMRVVAGLSSLARAGESAAPQAPRPNVVRRSGKKVQRRWQPKQEVNEFARTVTFSIGAAALTIVLGAVTVIALWPGGGDEEAAPVAQAGGPDTPPTPAPELDRSGRLARYRPLPTFLGNAVPGAAADAADASPRVPEELDVLARKLEVNGTLAEADFRAWETALNTVASGWVLSDDTTLDRVRRGIFNVLDRAGNADEPEPLVKRLLDEVVPPHRVVDPLDAWTGTWRAGMLGAVAGSPDLPPDVISRARNLAVIMLPDLDARVRRTFDGAAWAWLGKAVPGLVDMLDFEERAYDAWEMWLAAVRTLESPLRAEAHRLSALRGILLTSADLSTAGPHVNVFARLLSLSDFEGSPRVREAVLLWFDDPNVSGLDLWVLTSLLAQLDVAPWFDETLVLPDRADRAFRSRIRDRVASRWPEVVAPSGDGARDRVVLELDPLLRDAWVSTLAKLLARPVPQTADRMMQELTILAHFNEMALLLAQRRDVEAEGALETIVSMAALQPARPLEMPALEPPAAPASNRAPAQRAPVTVRDRRPPPEVRPAPGTLPRLRDPGQSPPRRPTSRTPAVPRSQTFGRDGEWAASYNGARRNTEERLKWLHLLSAQAGTDLGPIDAETFVRVVYRGASAELRETAGQILVEQFLDGRNVALEMLDQLPEAPTTRPVAETLREYTGQLLPPVRSAVWPVAARRALLEFALARAAEDVDPVDVWANWLSEAYARRGALVRGEADLADRLALLAPEDRAGELVDAWRERAELMLADRPAPADLPTLMRRRTTRRQLSDGPLQVFVSEQIAVLEILTYVTVAERPSRRDRAIDVLDRSRAPRQAAGSVLAQAIEAERAQARIWAVRFDLDEVRGEDDSS